jgi:hypothetical protein
MESAEMAGYHDFNALISAYYTSDFPESSSLSNEQRLSRNRRLPKVLFELFQATSSWSEWERRGFQEEILKTAENMLSLEGDSARRGLEIKLTPLLNALDDENNVGAKRQSIHAMKLLIQNEVRAIRTPDAPNSQCPILTLTLAFFPLGTLKWLCFVIPSRKDRKLTHLDSKPLGVGHGPHIQQFHATAAGSIQYCTCHDTSALLF